MASVDMASITIVCPICDQDVPAIFYYSHRDICRQYIKDPLVACPYDSRHRFCSEETKYHLSVCQSRRLTSGSEVFASKHEDKHNSSNQVCPTSHATDVNPRATSSQREKFEFELDHSVKLPTDILEAQLTQLSRSRCEVIAVQPRMFVVCQRCEAEIPANFASLLHHSLVDHKPVRIEPIDRYKCRYCRHSGQDWNELAKHVSLVHFGSSESSIADRFASLKSLSYAASLIRRNFGECQIETNPIGSSGTVDFYFNQSHFEAVERPNQEIFLRVKKKLMLANSQPYRKLPESPVFNFKRLRRN